MGSPRRRSVGSVQKKTWACISADRDGEPEPLTEERWTGLWAFGTGTSPGGLGLTSLEFWGLTPREFEALTKVWKDAREYQSSLYAELHATLRNTALGLGFKPPSGKFWTREMFLPNYKPSKSEPPDWQRDLAVMQQAAFPAGRPTREQMQEYAEGMKIVESRNKHAEQMRREGKSSEEIRHFLNTGG
jgi:Phage tail assembly chaperone protein, TAC